MSGVEVVGVSPHVIQLPNEVKVGRLSTEAHAAGDDRNQPQLKQLLKVTLQQW